MKPFLVIVLWLLLIGAWPAHTPAQAATAYVPDELIVRLAHGRQLDAHARLSGPVAPQLQQVLRQIGAQAARPIVGNAYQVQLRGHDPLSAAARLHVLPGVVYAEPNYLRRLNRVPNDAVVREQWALSNIQAFEAWDITTGAAVPIAIIDTGVFADHPDLAGRVLPGYNAINETADSNDDNGHGTAVAGLIAAATDNGIGVAGMCWGCNILPVKVLNAQGGGNDAGVARGVRWAVDNGARIINMSLGGTGDSRLLREAIDYALARNVLVVASSGNERSEGNAPNYPAAYPEVVAVGATGNTDVVTGFSNTGDYVDLTAPGVGLWTTLVDGGYGPPNGTSFASPYVAGAAGLVWTVRGDLGYQDIACILAASADDKGAPGKDVEYGWGRLNVLRALQLAQTYQGCPLNQAPAPPEPVPPEQPQPAPVPPIEEPPADPAPFVPEPPFASTANQVYFPETGFSLRGEFLRYWQQNGGLRVFGYPVSREFLEQGYVVQYFERNRFEFHPEQAPPFNVQLGRLGDTVLRLQGRDWFSFPRENSQPGCMFFEATGHPLCGDFLTYWRSSGLELDGRPGTTMNESLALFGAPISPPQTEEIAPGVVVTVQWFERARFEYHGSSGVRLGLLGNEVLRLRGVK
jgi:thermitase